MRNGDNTIGIFGTAFFDDLSIKMGNGNNLAAIVDETVVDKLDIKTGSGADSIGIAVCVSVGGKTKLKTGSGGDKSCSREPTRTTSSSTAGKEAISSS